MNATKVSKMILNKMFKDNYEYIRQDLPNRDYLENSIEYLQSMSVSYKNRSEDLTVDARSRSAARDSYQNCLGLINGIKYSISFLDHKDVNLFEYSQEIAKESDSNLT